MIISKTMAASMLTDADHVVFMKQALHEAEQALKRGEVAVGCVFVDPQTKTVIARGANRTNELYNATKHAELVAMEQLVDQFGHSKACALLRDSVLYVTCEPCIMCASALAMVQIQRAVFGCHNDRFGGNGSVLHLHQATAFPASSGHCGYPCTSGILQDEAIALLRRFYELENPRVEDSKKKKRKPKRAMAAIEINGLGHI